MGNASWWYYSDPVGGLEEIDCGTEDPSMLLEMPVRDVRDSHSIAGGFHRTVLGGGLRVRIVIERFSGLTTSGKKLMRQLASMESHLHRGGLAAFSADRDNAWAGVCTGIYLPKQQDTAVTCFGGNLMSVFTSTGTAAALAAGDELWIESMNPQFVREIALVSSESSGVITLDTTDGTDITYTHEGTSWVRERNFYPALRLVAEQVGRHLLQTQYRHTYTFDATFELDFTALESLIGQVDVLAGSDPMTGLTMEGAIAGVMAAGNPGEGIGDVTYTRGRGW